MITYKVDTVSTLSIRHQPQTKSTNKTTDTQTAFQRLWEMSVVFLLRHFVVLCPPSSRGQQLHSCTLTWACIPVEGRWGFCLWGLCLLCGCIRLYELSSQEWRGQKSGYEIQSAWNGRLCCSPCIEVFPQECWSSEKR